MVTAALLALLITVSSPNLVVVDSDLGQDLEQDVVSAVRSAIERTGHVESSTATIRLSLYESATKVRVIAVRPGPPTDRRAQTDLPMSRASWPGLLDPVAKSLFPPVLRSAETFTSVPPAPARRNYTGPVILFAATAASLGLASGFGLSAEGARSELSTLEPDSDRIASLTTRQSDHATVANVALVAAAIVGVAGLVWLLSP